jgi:hypothetical protein
MAVLVGLVMLLVALPGIAFATKPPLTVPAGTSSSEVVVVGQDVTIAGIVDGEVTVLLGNLHLTDTAVVRHDVAVIGGTLIRDPGARVGGDLVALRGTGDVISGLGWGLAAYGAMAGMKLLWITATVAAAVLWALWPRRSAAGVQPTVWRLLALGGLWAAALVLVAGALCYTLWGIPLAAGLLVVGAGLSCLGTGMLAERTGAWAMDFIGQERNAWQTRGLGALLLILPTGIPILGAGLLALIMVAGFGQFVAVIRRRRQASV